MDDARFDRLVALLEQVVDELTVIHTELYALDTARGDEIADEFDMAAVEVRFTLQQLKGSIADARRYLSRRSESG